MDLRNSLALRLQEVFLVPLLLAPPDGTLRCPANHPLYPQERRPERNGSLRVLYAARIGHCRTWTAAVHSVKKAARRSSHGESVQCSGRLNLHPQISPLLTPMRLLYHLVLQFSGKTGPDVLSGEDG
jgi:hypothetical protein